MPTIADPATFLDLLQPRARLTPRKARLFCIAVARHNPHLLDDPCRKAIQFALRYADGVIDDRALARACEQADLVEAHARTDRRALAAEAVSFATRPDPVDLMDHTRRILLDMATDLQVGLTLQLRWLQCLFGDAEHRLAAPTSFKTETVVRLARGI